MKHPSFKVEVFLVTGAWIIACGLVIALYFTAAAPMDGFLAVLVLVLMLIATGMYTQSAVRSTRNQKIIDSHREELGQIYEETKKRQDAISVLSKVKGT